ncbi:MAG TPA: transposase [Phycisphaerales bacterium]|nr:transposase [Phycisphaerales bacterium]
MPVLAYFITFHTYGSWLHGRDRGSVDRDHNRPGTPMLPPDALREAAEFAELKHPPIELCAERRYVVHHTIEEVCAYRKWILKVHHVRSTHVHVVVSAGTTPERVMNDLKGYSTRRMREVGVYAMDISPWSYHGSTRYIDSEESLVRAIKYVRDEQGSPLEMARPLGWDAAKSRRTPG